MTSFPRTPARRHFAEVCEKPARMLHCSQVADLMYTGPDWEDLYEGWRIAEQYEGAAARALIIALCSSPLLHTMKLARMYLECACLSVTHDLYVRPRGVAGLQLPSKLHACMVRCGSRARL